MRFLIPLIMAAVPTQLFGQSLTMDNCRLALKDDASRSIFRCDVTNHLETAVAGFRYAVKFTEPGRSVPWVDSEARRFGAPLTTDIPGGIEPNETVEIILRAPDLSPRADVAKVDFRFWAIEATDAKGNVIPLG